MLWANQDFSQDGWYEAPNTLVYLQNSKVMGCVVRAKFDGCDGYDGTTSFFCFNALVEVYNLSVHIGKCIGSFGTLGAAKKAVEEELFSAQRTVD